METASCCQTYFGFALPITLWTKLVQKFELQFSNLCIFHPVGVILHIITLAVFIHSVCFKLLRFGHILRHCARYKSTYYYYCS